MSRRLLLVVAAFCFLGCDDKPHSIVPNDDPSPAAKMAEHAVLVYVKLSDSKFGTVEEREAIHAFSDTLEAMIEKANVGEFDGDEFGQGECTLFMYGGDADSLFRTIEPALRKSPLCKGGHVIKRYGSASDPNAKEIRVELDRVEER